MVTTPLEESLLNISTQTVDNRSREVEVQTDGEHTSPTAEKCIALIISHRRNLMEFASGRHSHRSTDNALMEEIQILYDGYMRLRMNRELISWNKNHR